MAWKRSATLALALAGTAFSQGCPFGYAGERRDTQATSDGPVYGADFLNQFTINASNNFLTSDVGGPICKLEAIPRAHEYNN
jgi:hypothetical protein